MRKWEKFFRGFTAIVIAIMIILYTLKVVTLEDVVMATSISYMLALSFMENWTED